MSERKELWNMEKIKFNFEEQKNKIVKFEGQKIEIRPYVLASEKVIISDICCQQIKTQTEDGKRNSIHTARIVFDMVLVALCSNIEIDGVKMQIKKNKVVGVSIDVKEPILEQFEKSGLALFVENNIDNCEKIWEDTVKDIEISTNSLVALFDDLKKIIPSEEKQKAILSELKTTIEDFAKENPNIAKETLTKPIKNVVLKEMHEKKDKEKVQKINNKK